VLVQCYLTLNNRKLSPGLQLKNIGVHRGRLQPLLCSSRSTESKDYGPVHVSVWLSRFPYGIGNPHDTGLLLEHTIVTTGTDHCWNTLLQQWEQRSLLGHIVTAMGTEVIVSSQWPRITLSPQMPLLHLLFLSRKSDLSPQFLCAAAINKAACRLYCPCCGVKKTWGISVYSKEYTFTILLTSNPRRKSLWFTRFSVTWSYPVFTRNFMVFILFDFRTATSSKLKSDINGLIGCILVCVTSLHCAPLLAF
jgi:hypothetical protein